MKVKYTIETSWSIHGYEDVIDIPDEDMEDLDERERDKYIEETVSDAVNNVVSWGFEVIE